MTYEATVTLKFDSKFTYSSYSSYDDHSTPEEHIEFTAPASDLTAKQYFNLFERFLLSVGMHPDSIRSGAISLVFNDFVREEEQRKICNEYDLTMNEDLHDKFQDWKKSEEEIAQFVRGPMGTVLSEKDLEHINE